MVASVAGQCVGQTSEQVGQQILLQIPNARLWSPDDPFLYNLEISLVGTRNITYGTVLNTCAMRYCDLFLHSIMHTVHNEIYTRNQSPTGEVISSPVSAKEMQFMRCFGMLLCFTQGIRYWKKVGFLRSQQS